MLSISTSSDRKDSFSSSRPRYRRFVLPLLLIALIGFTSAATTQINNTGNIEFGQGIYQIKSCDQFVAIALNPTSTYSDGYSRVLNITFQGVDVKRCANTSVRVRLYGSGSASPLNLFTNPAYTKSGVTYPCCTETGTAVTLVFAANATQATALQSTTLISPSGKNIAQGDRSESLSYDSTKGIFTVAFAVPLAIMRDVTSTTLESAPNV